MGGCRLGSGGASAEVNLHKQRADAAGEPIAPERVLAVIPARIASSRLPEKALLDIAGRPMIAHVVRTAAAARRVGRVVVATDDQRIAAAAEAAGAVACLTRGDHESGSDRILEALESLGLGGVDIVLNIQGDEPLLPAPAIDRLVELLESHPEAGVSTLVCPMASDDPDCDDPNVVKAVFNAGGRALYFSRARIPAAHPRGHATPTLFRHVGVYGYRRSCLERFAQTPPSPLERAEGLEQLRLLEANVEVYVGVVDELPAGVDTAEDLERVRRILEVESRRPS
jgi:3-deoxy-manno-octulosonate cytidylyltransferase (CMP-KDO synthetase)